jgi:hypothetical protein
VCVYKEEKKKRVRSERGKVGECGVGLKSDCESVAREREAKRAKKRREEKKEEEEEEEEKKRVSERERERERAPAKQ